MDTDGTHFIKPLMRTFTFPYEPTKHISMLLSPSTCSSLCMMWRDVTWRDATRSDVTRQHVHMQRAIIWTHGVRVWYVCSSCWRRGPFSWDPGAHTSHTSRAFVSWHDWQGKVFPCTIGKEIRPSGADTVRYVNTLYLEVNIEASKWSSTQDESVTSQSRDMCITSEYT